MFRHFAATLPVACLALAQPVLADDVTDTLQSAIAAYEEGDIAYAMEELDFARQLLAQQKTEQLTGFLPPAPEGWTRELSDDMTAGMAFMGGGSGAEASYTNGTESFTITIAMDNPMVAALAPMISNAGLMGGKLVRVGREKFLSADGEVQGVIDNRILIQASGASEEVMTGVLSQIDFAALSDFAG